MNSDFRVDESGRTADGYLRLQPSCKKSMYIGNCVILVILLAVFVAVMLYSDKIFGDASGMVRMISVAVFIIIAAYLLIGPIVFYKRYRYKMDDDKLEIRRGIVFITHTLVPMERIHQVQVSRGPINRMFGLADVIVTTAGGVTALEYLETDVAESVASRLNDCVVKMLKDRE